jgi:hypothetical protein
MWQFNTRHNGVYGDIDPIVSISNGATSTAHTFQLRQNYPNPFNTSTRIEFEIYKKGKVTLEIYDINGKLIQELVNSYLSEGSYIVNFDANKLPSGVYFYRLLSNGKSTIKKMVLVK